MVTTQRDREARIGHVVSRLADMPEGVVPVLRHLFEADDGLSLKALAERLYQDRYESERQEVVPGQGCEDERLELCRRYAEHYVRSSLLFDIGHLATADIICTDLNGVLRIDPFYLDGVRVFFKCRAVKALVVYDDDQARF